MKKLEYYGNKNVIHHQLKMKRIEKSLTQQQLAAKMQTYNINIDQQAISKIEKNKRMVADYELATICAILKIDEKELLKDYYDATLQADL